MFFALGTWNDHIRSLHVQTERSGQPRITDGGLDGPDGPGSIRVARHEDLHLAHGHLRKHVHDERLLSFASFPETKVSFSIARKQSRCQGSEEVKGSFLKQSNWSQEKSIFATGAGCPLPLPMLVPLPFWPPPLPLPLPLPP